MIRFAQLLAVLMTAFFSLNSYATGDKYIDWIDPQDNKRWHIWAFTGWAEGNTADEAATEYVSIRGWTECRRETIHSEPGLVRITIYYNASGGECVETPPGQSLDITEFVDGAECSQLDWPRGEDTDDDGIINHCHKSQCEKNMEMLASGASIETYLCVPTDDSVEYCEYRREVVVDPNNENFGFDVLLSTGESCGGDVNDLSAPPYYPQDDDQLPDPTDPNNPPSDNGDPDCTPIDGTGLNVCTENPDEVCDSSSGVRICPSGCGTVNDVFSCIRDDTGSDVDTDVPEDDNDNSDDVSDDDPNTQGDEGTHSRLDGLLENTDGLEGLLRGIKEAIGDIPGGGGDSQEPGEEEPNCPEGQYYIGESCVTFDKNDRPTNAELDETGADSEIDRLEGELTAKYNEIKASLDSKFSVALTGGAYTQNTVTLKGRSVELGMDRLNNLFNFSLWGAVVLFIAAVSSMFILVRS